MTSRSPCPSWNRSDSPPHGGTPLPPLWHWLYFLPVHRASEIGPDGHAQRGGFLPPIALPRRMWAGGRVRFPGAVRLGRPAERRSHVVAVEEKAGRSGRLVIVTVAHTILQDGAVATSEEQDLIYRGSAAEPDRAAAEPASAEEVEVRRIESGRRGGGHDVGPARACRGSGGSGTEPTRRPGGWARRRGRGCLPGGRPGRGRGVPSSCRSPPRRQRKRRGRGSCTPRAPTPVAHP